MEPKPKKETGRVLVLDDDRQTRKMMRRILEKTGCDVQTAADGREAIRYFRENPADLVITDLIMPEKEGVAMIAELRKDIPEARGVSPSRGMVGTRRILTWKWQKVLVPSRFMQNRSTERG